MMFPDGYVQYTGESFSLIVSLWVPYEHVRTHGLSDLLVVVLLHGPKGLVP